MKYRLFPKEGSFHSGGRNIRGTFNETRLLIDSLANIRRKQLDSLTAASKEFKELEFARITADIINNYLCYPAAYVSIFQKSKT